MKGIVYIIKYINKKYVFILLIRREDKEHWIPNKIQSKQMLKILTIFCIYLSKFVLQ